MSINLNQRLTTKERLCKLSKYLDSSGPKHIAKRSSLEGVKAVIRRLHLSKQVLHR